MVCICICIYIAISSLILFFFQEFGMTVVHCFYLSLISITSCITPAFPQEQIDFHDALEWRTVNLHPPPLTYCLWNKGFMFGLIKPGGGVYVKAGGWLTYLGNSHRHQPYCNRHGYQHLSRCVKKKRCTQLVGLFPWVMVICQGIFPLSCPQFKRSIPKNAIPSQD